MPSATTRQSRDLAPDALTLFPHAHFGLHFPNSGFVFLLVGLQGWITLGLIATLRQLLVLAASFVTSVRQTTS